MIDADEHSSTQKSLTEERVSRDDVLDFVVRYVPVLLFTTVLALALGYFLLSGKDPAYRAEAQVMVERNLSPTLRTEVLPDAQLTDVINTEVILVTAPPTLSRAIASLDVSGGATASTDGAAGDRPRIEGLEGLKKEVWLDRLDRRLSVRPIPDSNIFTIAYTDTEPALAADVVNSVLEAYLAQRLSIFRGDKASIVFAAEADAAKKELEDLNLELNELGNGIALTETTPLQNALSAERSQLTSSRLTLLSQRAALLETYFEDHPKVLQLDAEIRAIDQRRNQIASEIANVDQRRREAVKLQVEIEAAQQKFLNASTRRDQAALRELQNSALANVRVVFRAEPPTKPATSFSLQLAIIGAIGLFSGLCIVFVLQYFREAS